MKFTRMLLSLAVAMMLVGFTLTAQDMKEEPKQETTTKAPAHHMHSKHTKKAMKAKLAHAKKKSMKEKKEAPPAK